MLVSRDIYILLEFFNFLIWTFYGLDIIALLIIKRRNKKAKFNCVSPVKFEPSNQPEEIGYKMDVRKIKHSFVNSKFKIILF